MKNYEKAVEYYHQYGNLLVPTRYVCEDGKKLGIWIQNQREAYKNRTIPKEKRTNTFSPLTDEQVKLLENIGMMWPVRNRQDHYKRKYVKWMTNYKKAREYYQKYGNLLVSDKYTCEDKTKLGKWIANQRIAYKNRFIPQEKRKNTISPLTDEQVKLLEEIGMIWSVRKVQKATKQKQDLINRWEVVEKEIQSKKISTETNKWLMEQFELQEQNKLTRNQVVMLKNIGAYTTSTYQTYFKQAFLEVFKKVLYDFRDHRSLLDPTEITRLGWTYEKWYDVFNKNVLGILNHKQYEVWKRVYQWNHKQIKVLKK